MCSGFIVDRIHGTSGWWHHRDGIHQSRAQAPNLDLLGSGCWSDPSQLLPKMSDLDRELLDVQWPAD